MQLRSLIPILILLIYVLVSIDLVYFGFARLDNKNCSREEQLFANLLKSVLLLKLWIFRLV